MNRRLCVWVVSIFFCVALVSTAIAQGVPGGGGVPAAPGATAPGATAPGATAPGATAPGATAPGATVPAGASTATAGPQIPPGAETAADASQFASDIRKYIAYQMTALSGSDFAGQTNARDALRKALTRGSTQSYYSVFCKEWSAACTPLLTKSPPPPLGVRLNIAIVTSVLTDNGQTMDPTTAEPIAESLVDLLLLDKTSASVSLWGIKAARPLVMVRMQMGKAGNKPALDATSLAGSIVAAVKNNEKSDIAGFMVQDAYTDLAVKDIPALTAAQIAPMQPPLVEYILPILESRVEQYKSGAVQCPGAEQKVATFLYTQYASVPPATQKRIVQALVNLITYAGQRSDQYINSRADLNQLRDMLKYVTSSLKQMAADKTVDTSLSWLSAIPPASTPPEIVAHTKLVAGVLKTAFPWVATPAEIPVIAPPPIKPAPGVPAATSK